VKNLQARKPARSQIGEIPRFASDNPNGSTADIAGLCDPSGRVLALEILTNTPAVANVIREAKTFMLPGIIQTGKKQGMQLMDDALIELQSRGLITADEALARADQKQEMRTRLKT